MTLFAAIRKRLRGRARFIGRLRRRSLARHYATKAGLNRGVLEVDYCVLDTELTGLNYKKDAIVSIGGIKMTGSRIKVGETFYATVKPRTDLTKESVVVHGITPSEVNDRPPLDSVIMDFLNFCGDAVIVGHFLSLDMKFLNKELQRAFNRKIENPQLDTWLIYDWIEKQYLKTIGYDEILSGNKDLLSLAKKYNIEISESHNALMDAFVTAQLFQRLMIQVQGMGIRTIKELLKIGGH